MTVTPAFARSPRRRVPASAAHGFVGNWLLLLPLLLASVVAFNACSFKIPPRTDTTAPPTQTDTGSTTETTDTVSTDATTDTMSTQIATTPAAPTIEEMRQTIVDLETTAGTISIEFFPDQAPNHVRNFINLARSGFYDGINFHRIIPGFVIQGGDPNTRDGPRETWGTGGSATRLAPEFNKIPHERGILSMARSQDPNSATSQFFICVAEAPSLNEQYTVFGKVQSGMDVVDQIVAGKAHANEQPEVPVVIKRAIVRKSP